ncbi:hypothetical protein [Streptomyces tauricus]
MVEQATRQASDQFEHWLRQERRVAYGEMLRDVNDFQMKTAAVVSHSYRTLSEVEALQALEELHTAHITLIQRVGPLATVAGNGVFTGFRDYVAQCRRLFTALAGCTPENLPVEALGAHYDALNDLNGTLVASVATEMQTAPTAGGGGN